jgi:hypothetical protein
MTARVEFELKIAENRHASTTILYRSGDLEAARHRTAEARAEGKDAHLYRLTIVETRTEIEP